MQKTSTAKATNYKSNTTSSTVIKSALKSQSPLSPQERLLQLHRQYGNKAVQRMYESRILQAKLKIDSPNDKYEQEADQVAERVMSIPDPQIGSKTTLPFAKYSQRGDEESSFVQMPSEDKPIQTKSPVEQITPITQRQTEPEEEEEIQTKPLADQITPLMQRQIEPDEEEESVQTKTLQPQAEEEEEVQKQTEEEIVQAKPFIQGQREKEEEALLQGKFTTSESLAQFQSDGYEAENSTGMPDQLKKGLEKLSGVDLSGARVHGNSSKPAQINALAYTQGQDIHVSPGQERHLAHEGWHLVQQLQGRVEPTMETKGVSINDDAGLEREADLMGTKALHMTAASTKQIQDHHRARQNRTQLIQCRPLNRAERRSAIAYAGAKFDEMSVRIIQRIAGLAGADIDGDFGRNTARAVSDFQTANGIAPDDGLVHQNSLDVMIANRVAANRRNEAIHLVTDFYDLDITTDTLAVYYQPGATRVNPTPPPANFPADTDFESGGLRVIRVGTAAFTNAVTLRDTIRRELSRVAPAPAGPAAPHGSLLNRTQVRNAIRYMNRHYQDRRSIMALQGLFVGVNPTGIVDADIVQRIADVQNATPALAQVDGMVGRNTLEQFFVQLRDSGNEDAAIRLVTDFYDMPDYNNLLAIYYDPTVGASTDFHPRMPVRVRLGDALFLPFEAMVHSIRHELEHVGNLRRGIANRNIQEFLSEASEIISTGMPHETLFTVVAGGLISGFQHDLGRMMDNWDLIPTPADQRTHWGTFVRARRVIRRRIARTFRPTRAADQAEWAAATPAQRAALTALLARVNAVARP